MSWNNLWFEKVTWSNFGKCDSYMCSNLMKLSVCSEVENFSCLLINRVQVVNITFVEKLLPANSDCIHDWVSYFGASSVVSMWRRTPPMWRLNFVIGIVGVAVLLHGIFAFIVDGGDDFCQLIMPVWIVPVSGWRWRSPSTAGAALKCLLICVEGSMKCRCLCSVSEVKLDWWCSWRARD